MKQSVLRLFALMILIVTASVVSFAQSSAAGSISGVVKDPNGAVVVGATVNVKNPGNGQEYSATTSDNGTFTVPAIPAGKYNVTITAQGFKTSVVKDVEVLAATPASVDIALQVGATGETIQVTGAGEVLQTQSASVSNTIVGRQITDLPFASRNALDLVLFLPGTASPARPRQSTVNGLPKGSLNITLDGINVQDNLLKSSDGFFTYIQPKTDAIDEVTVSSNTPGSESSGEGAVQVKFITRGGNNSFNGSVYEYLRNPSLNANYYFNNLNGLPRTRVILNQPGFRFGGPIIKDRVFFFVNYEEYRLPESTLRQRTIFTPDAQAGIFKYGTSQVNLLALAASSNACAPKPSCTSTIDPTVSSLLAAIRSSTASGTVSPLSDPNLQNFAFINAGGQTRKFPTVRFDLNVTSKQHIENIWNYQQFDNVVDFLNNLDPRFPGFPNHGAQTSNRFSETIALRSTVSQNIVNEFRFGLTGGTVRFFSEITPAQFANQGGVNLGIGAAGITSATAGTAPQKRNSPVWQFNDSLSWTRGNHSLNFGMSFTQINLFSQFPPAGIVPAVTLGVNSADPANNMFVVANFPGASTTQLAQAASFYGVLTGTVTAISGTAVINGSSYTNFGQYEERDRQREMGYFAQDTWRFRPNLTLTGGLRWEVQFPFTPLNQNYASTSVAELFGISGTGHIFSSDPATTLPTGGVQTQFRQFNAGDHTSNTQWGNFAPTIGIAWSPNFKDGWLRKLGGESGQTVIRGGYSIAYVREGTSFVSTALGTNPGGTRATGKSVALGTITAGTLFRDPGLAPLAPPPLAFPIIGGLSDQAVAFDPDLRTGRVHSWTFGIQRELNKDTVIEARYVGNRAMDLWRLYSVGERDVLTNGFINEFKLAQQNLAANKAAGLGNTFAYTGIAGTSPLPISVGYLTGTSAAGAATAANYHSIQINGVTQTTFTNATAINALASNLPSPSALAAFLTGNTTFLNQGVAAGIRANYFVDNPQLNSSFIVDNSSRSYYDSFQFELRRRLSKGLLFQGSYVFSKSLTNSFASSSFGQKNYISLHNLNLDRGASPFDINHALKANFIYEFPIGKGQRFLDTTNGVVDHLVSGWSFNGTVRIQSGTPNGLGNVQLVGMSPQELQDSMAIRHDVARNPATGAVILNPQTGLPTPVVYFLPPDIIQGTFNAFNGTFAPTGRYIAPVNMNSPSLFPGAVGYPNLILYGPHFTRFDLSFVKRTKVTERINVEFRTELLDAFNNINFRLAGATADVGTVGGFSSAAFGQTTLAYQDTSTTNDPGGRLIQFVLRINF